MLLCIIMVGMIGMMSVILPFWDFGATIKWWGAGLLLVFVFALATLNY